MSYNLSFKLSSIGTCTGTFIEPFCEVDFSCWECIRRFGLRLFLFWIPLCMYH